MDLQNASWRTRLFTFWSAVVHKIQQVVTYVSSFAIIMGISWGKNRSNISIRELPDVMSAKCLDLLDLFPPCPHLELICSIKCTQPPLLLSLFQDPPPPSDADTISGSSLTRSSDQCCNGAENCGLLCCWVACVFNT